MDGECGDTAEEECTGNWSANTSCTGVDDLPLPICNTGCSWDNGPPLDDNGAPATQFDPDPGGFGAGAADDFILKDSGDNDCQILEITAWTAHFNAPDGAPDASPNDYTGVNVTVYGNALPKGPGGQPEDDGTHTGDVIVTVTIPIADITFVQEPTVCNTTIWKLDIPVSFVLPKNVKMWLEIQPIMPFGGDVGQVAVVLSQNSTGHPAQQIFPAAGLPDWTVIGGNGNACPPDTPLAGTRRDLAFNMIGEKLCDGNGICDGNENSCNCEADCGACEGTCVSGACCGDGVVEGHEECDFGGCGTCPTDGPVNGPNGSVGAEDLAFILGNWGSFAENPLCNPDCPPELVCIDDLDPAQTAGNQNIGPEDLAKVLGTWGDCPG
ncbi:MAG: hypothetical protein IH899_05935 [Planctomycetes bacterium]|nr:hypothetical protein [Planctomycetota bacterium]